MHLKVGCQPPYKVRRRSKKELEITINKLGLPFYLWLNQHARSPGVVNMLWPDAKQLP
jgi:hypothetical protein